MPTTPKDKLNKMILKREQAVELWRKTHGHISNVCRAIGISRTTFYEWMQDPIFAQQLRDAEAELNDDMRDLLINRAGEGATAELIFYLKSRHPDFKPTPIQINTQNNFYDQAKEQRDKYNED